MKELANKMVTLTFMGLFITVFTIISIPLSFKWWSINGLLVPSVGILALFYVSARIEIIRRKCQIKSYYDLTMLLNDKKPNIKTSSIEGQNFHALGLLYSMVVAVSAMFLLFLSFYLFY